MRCDLCNQSGPTAYVELHHNVGMIFLREQHATKGRLCRSCLHRSFGHHMLRNVTLGWWGSISFLITWVFLLSNSVTYAGALWKLRRAAASAQVLAPTVTDAASAERLLAFEHNVRLRLRAGETSDDITRDLASLHGLHAAQVATFVDRVRASNG